QRLDAAHRLDQSALPRQPFELALVVGLEGLCLALRPVEIRLELGRIATRIEVAEVPFGQRAEFVVALLGRRDGRAKKTGHGSQLLGMRAAGPYPWALASSALAPIPRMPDKPPA